jgi:hypothetical protein
MFSSASRNLRTLNCAESEVQQEGVLNWSNRSRSLKVLDMPLVEMEDVNLRVLFNMATFWTTWSRSMRRRRYACGVA